MAGNSNKLVIVGDGETAELAFDYFTRDSHLTVVGFSAESAYRKNRSLLGLPVVDFEEIEQHFNPKSHCAFVAVSYTNLNTLRRRLFEKTKQKGYRLCSYKSPSAHIGSAVTFGENCFILENVVIQRAAKIGNNVMIWSGSSIGHRSSIGNHCFLASQVALSGFCEVGEGSFLGVNSCTVGNIKIGVDCVVGAGAVLTADAVSGQVYVGNPAKSLPNKKTDVFVSGKETI